MKKYFYISFILIVLFVLQTASAQNPITTLQHAGTTKVFYGTTSFVDAYTASTKGDTLLLSVGTFTPPASIIKSLTIIGAGYFPDSVSVKKRTSISGTINIGKGADYLHIEGAYITGDVSYLSNLSSDTITILSLSRCRATNIVFNGCNCKYRECIIDGNIEFRNFGYNSAIENNIIKGKVSNIKKNSIITNNIFLTTDNPFEYVNSSVINNNIILRNNTSYILFGVDCSNNSCNNNLFVGSSTLNKSSIYSINNTGNNNYQNIQQSEIFINQSGNLFDFTHNYHLKSPINYIGTDGTQVGLYGGLIPFKDGGYPSNPQIIYKSVDTKTDTNGNLKINFTVKAQEN